MSTGAIIGLCFGVGIACLIVGGLIGFKIASSIFKKQMKKNPPITEDQIRAMYAQMGRKPSESQVRQIMNQFKNKIDEK